MVNDFDLKSLDFCKHDSCLDCPDTVYRLRMGLSPWSLRLAVYYKLGIQGALSCMSSALSVVTMRKGKPFEDPEQVRLADWTFSLLK